MNTTFKTIIEPFRIKVVEPLPMLTSAERGFALEKAHYNLFFAGSNSNLRSTDRQRNERHVGPSMGRTYGRRRVLCRVDQLRAFRAGDPGFDGDGIRHSHPSGALRRISAHEVSRQKRAGGRRQHSLDTTRANIENVGAEALDFPCAASGELDSLDPFKGNIDLEKLAVYLKTDFAKVAMGIMTITNNSVGGQPVSFDNIKAASNLLKTYGIPFFIDCARFAENAYLIKCRDPRYRDWPVKRIAQEVFSLADGALISAKKDAFANIGGFLATRSEKLAVTCVVSWSSRKASRLTAVLPEETLRLWQSASMKS